jgi:hypothetical protein
MYDTAGTIMTKYFRADGKISKTAIPGVQSVQFQFRDRILLSVLLCMTDALPVLFILLILKP